MEKKKFSLNKKIFSTILISASLIFGASNLFAATKVNEQKSKLITFALQYQGVPYVTGGQTPKGFDCSGYVMYCFNHALNIQIPRTCNAIFKKVKVITPSEREAGDLVFFKANPKDEKITHVGIYCGVYHGSNKKFEGKRVFISAVSDGPSTGIQLQLMDQKYWKEHYYASGRLLEPTIRR